MFFNLVIVLRTRSLHLARYFLARCTSRSGSVASGGSGATRADSRAHWRCATRPASHAARSTTSPPDVASGPAASVGGAGSGYVNIC